MQYNPYPVSLRDLPDPEPGEQPPHPYTLLIKLAIQGSPQRRLTLEGIYEAVEVRFEWYREHAEEWDWKVPRY